MPVFFNGRLWTTPAVMSTVDDSAMANTNVAVGNVLALIGKCTGGAPQHVHTFSTPTDALSALKSGELADAVRMAFDPSAQIPGPATIKVVRIDPATKGTGTLTFTGGSISLTSNDYGSSVNFTVSVTSGASSAVVSITSGAESIVSKDLWDTNAATTATAIANWLNGDQSGGLVSATVTGTITTLATVSATLTGANGSATTDDWQSGFDLLQTEDVQWVVPVTSLAAIHAMADAHVQYMSTTGLKERRAVVGGALGESVADQVTAANNLNSDRTSLCYPGIKEYSASGVLTSYPPFMTAVRVAAMFSGANPGTPMTNKAIKARGVELKLKNPSETDELINGGVLAIESTAQGYRIVKSISTWLVNKNYNRVEQSTGFALDFVSRAVRGTLDELKGAKGSPKTIYEAISRVNSILYQLSIPEPIGPGVLVGDAENPPYRSVEAKIDGDKLHVAFQCSPVIPINYIPVSIFAVPWGGSAT